MKLAEKYLSMFESKLGDKDYKLILKTWHDLVKSTKGKASYEHDDHMLASGEMELDGDGAEKFKAAIEQLNKKLGRKGREAGDGAMSISFYSAQGGGIVASIKVTTRGYVGLKGSHSDNASPLAKKTYGVEKKMLPELVKMLKTGKFVSGGDFAAKAGTEFGV